MEASGMASDEVVAKLTEMGFELSLAAQAVEVVGPSLNNAVDYILTQSSKQNESSSTSHKVSGSTQTKSSNKRSLSKLRPLGRTKQTSIREVIELRSSTKKIRNDHICDVQIGFDLDQRVSRVLQKHFGFSSLKSFQKEALNAWASHQDCLVLAATGSGKSLCFQIPALLTGKVVVVLSPLISLMHDQCLKLASHGVSACFLGSGQPDNSIENKAMNGMYQIIYVCPETVLRLMQPLQELAENHGIALFAIDEVHCVSKWGHDFRPAYRSLSILRETFTACNMEFLKFDIPIMALTATATLRVREDILQSLCMSKETKIVLTSFFRPNLQFSVKHSTCSSSSYKNDFCELVELYSGKTVVASKKEQGFVWLGKKETTGCSSNTTNGIMSDASSAPVSNVEDDTIDVNGKISSASENGLQALKGKQLSAEYLEDDFDDLQTADDFDVKCGEFSGQLASEKQELCNSAKSLHPSTNQEETPKCLNGSLEQGPTIIYTPTRAESVLVATFLSVQGVKAAAYNASLPKPHLRQVHKEFHANKLDVVVATVAFGMGIDKHNVRRIIHYGWPQSLEAYYQEAGRAGRDGKPADCILYANLACIPTLLPSKRSEEQTIQSYAMLTDCFRYGMSTSQCRAKILVEYFGEEFSGRRCTLCDTCKNGPPVQENLKAEASVFLQVIAAAYHRQLNSEVCYDDFLSGEHQSTGKPSEKPGLKMFISKTREHSKEFVAKGELWWRGLARVLENRGLIKEGEEMRRVQIRCPELTHKGIKYLEDEDEDEDEEGFWVYPEADMLLVVGCLGFSQWGRGWADPEIRKQRLEKRRANRKPRRKKRDKSFFEKLAKKYG